MQLPELFEIIALFCFAFAASGIPLGRLSVG